LLQDAYVEVFRRFVALESLSICSIRFYLQAAQLRARFGLSTPDLLHLVCPQHHRYDARWINDNRLAEASHGLAEKIL